MRLTIATPTADPLTVADVAHVRAEDETGAFGILEGHADFLTALVPSVLSWRTAGGGEGHAAVRGGVLTVSGGTDVAVATREAVTGRDLATLRQAVAARFRGEREEEAGARAAAARLHLAAVRLVLGYLGRAQPPGIGRPRQDGPP